MEGPGARAVTFASGQAASMALMLALAEPGRDAIVFPCDGYYNTRALAARLRPHGARAAAVDLLDLDAVAAAPCATVPAVLWAETPTNPLLRWPDPTALPRRWRRPRVHLSSWTTRWRRACCSGHSTSVPRRSVYSLTKVGVRPFRRARAVRS